jgi:electron transfer flavoprotein alpha/beta subunit
VRFYQNDNKVLITQEVGSLKNMVEIEFPVVFAVDSKLEIQPPKIFDYIKSQNSLVSVYSNDFLELNEDSIGLKGSKTIVKKAYKANSKRNTTILSIDDGVSYLVSSLNLEAKDEN